MLMKAKKNIKIRNSKKKILKSEIYKKKSLEMASFPRNLALIGLPVTGKF